MRCTMNENITVKKIENVTLRLFVERGYEATTIKDICKEIDIKAPSLYFYFELKEKLFLNLLDKQLSELINSIGTLYKSEENVSIEEKLFHLYQAINRMLFDRSTNCRCGY